MSLDSAVEAKVSIPKWMFYDIVVRLFPRSCMRWAYAMGRATEKAIDMMEIDQELRVKAEKEKKLHTGTDVLIEAYARGDLDTNVVADQVTSHSPDFAQFFRWRLERQKFAEKDPYRRAKLMALAEALGERGIDK